VRASGGNALMAAHDARGEKMYIFLAKYLTRREPQDDRVWTRFLLERTRDYGS
jgi:hypothetical protein